MSAENRESSTHPAPSGSNSDVEIIPGYQTIEQFTKDGFKTLMEAIKHSNALPGGRDWSFYNTFDAFPRLMNEEGGEVLRLMNAVMKCNDIDANIKNKVLGDKTELLVEANDAILEKVANNIDEMNGIRKTVPQAVLLQTVSAHIPVNGSWNRAGATTFVVNSSPSEVQNKPPANCITLTTGKYIVRPQKLFKDKIDNSVRFPWQPRIVDKPNSLKPLAIFLEEFEDRQEFSHPYELELDRFTPTPEQLLEETPEKPRPISDTPLVEINDARQLDDLVETLRNCKEFAVDLEHHSYRSFMGITCLMQISTRDKDYIIDTLSLRDKLCILNEVFTKPTIVKIFHGADKDVEWLQRDLSIYVVNMFDTHQACKALEYSGRSLAYLMDRFCKVVLDKQFQLADWRIRPLPDEFKKYAREDTHYLIYIYQMLKKELLSRGSDKLLRVVIERSTDLCKKRYFKPTLTDDSHMDLYRRCQKLFDNRQLYALKELYTWRDHMAREEDESRGYILPNHMLLQISENLPREMQGILACCNPIPPLVRSNLQELHQIVLKARDQPLEKPIMKEDTRGPGATLQVSKIDMNSPLYCPHDLSKTEFRDNLSTLLDNDALREEIVRRAEAKLNIEKDRPAFSIFDKTETSKPENATVKKVRSLFLSPYQRYLLTKQFVQAEEEKAATQKEEEDKKRREQADEAQKQEDRRTDDDRIASMREHFLQMSEQFKEKEREMSLIEMGGSRKRKRQSASEESEDEEPAEKQPFGINLQTPVPDMFTIDLAGRSNDRKRRFDDEEFDEESANRNRRNWHQFNAPKNRGEMNQQGGNQQQQQTGDEQEEDDQPTENDQQPVLTKRQLRKQKYIQFLRRQNKTEEEIQQILRGSPKKPVILRQTRARTQQEANAQGPRGENQMGKQNQSGEPKKTKRQRKKERADAMRQRNEARNQRFRGSLPGEQNQPGKQTQPGEPNVGKKTKKQKKREMAELRKQLEEAKRQLAEARGQQSGESQPGEQNQSENQNVEQKARKQKRIERAEHWKQQAEARGEQPGVEKKSKKQKWEERAQKQKELNIQRQLENKQKRKEEFQQKRQQQEEYQQRAQQRYAAQGQGQGQKRKRNESREDQNEGQWQNQDRDQWQGQEHDQGQDQGRYKWQNQGQNQGQNQRQDQGENQGKDQGQNQERNQWQNEGRNRRQNQEQSQRQDQGRNQWQNERHNQWQNKGHNQRQNQRQNQGEGQSRRGRQQQLQDNTNFVPFDYASVDFRQFQGGAGSVTGGVQLKPAYKTKGWKKMGNRGAKSSTFTGNRGRGRGR